MEYAEIRDYIEINNEPHLTPDELDHVALCMEHISWWYYKNYPLGHFLTAVVKNNLIEAVFRADDINARALKLYAWFLMWKLPDDYRKKASEL